MVIVGVDPGGRWTGIVIRSGQELVSHTVLTRPQESPMDDFEAGIEAWVTEVQAGVRTALEEALELGEEVALAVEGIAAPNPHQRRADGNSLTNVNGILATAVVFGALLQEYRGRVIIIPPGGNGTRARGAYPAEIDMPPGLRKGPPKDKNRHARSAWDVAGQVPFVLGLRRSANRVGR